MRFRWVAVACVAAASALASGVAVADIPDGGVFHGCVKQKNGDDEQPLRLIDTSSGGKCKKNESMVSWNATGPRGRPVPAGPSTSVLMNRNFEDMATNSFPGVKVAHLDLGPGTWVVQAKFRYRNNGSTRQTASCIFQGTGVGDLDGSQQNVDGGGEQNGQVDGVLMDIVIKRPGDPAEVHLQCFGPGDGSIHIVNPQLMAALPGNLSLQ